MLDCKHAGPSLPPSLSLWQRAWDHTASWGQEAERRSSGGVGLGAPGVGREEGPKTQWPAEHS